MPRLPPFFALRALEAAARHRSYSRAADELTKYIELEPHAADATKIRETIKDLRSKK